MKPRGEMWKRAWTCRGDNKKSSKSSDRILGKTNAGKKPKLEASFTDEPAAGTQVDEVELCRSVRRKHRESQKSPSDSMPRGGEKYTKKHIVKVYQGLCRVHGSSKLAEKKKKREPSESPKRRKCVCGESGRLQEQQDGVQYGTKGYHPLENAFWRKSETVTCLARTFQIIEKTSERLRMIKILANYFWSVILSPDDLLARRQAGHCGALVDDAIKQSTGRSLAQILMDAQTTADQSKSSHRMMFRPAPLSVKDVFGKLRKINKMTGTDDGQDSVDVCGGLTRFASVEKLPKAKVEDVALVLKTIVPLLLVDKCSMMPGTPLRPVLAHPPKGVQKVLERFDGIDLSASGSTTEIGRLSTCWRTAALTSTVGTRRTTRACTRT
ncbi:conserved hypothetical protein [Culex quinquefasciatus]|uniref:Uncharacterized protein n=1 Tax=Culex quinquefasciatus TaxID=7176 RepID=B0X7T9_CULQU|nr:conserved hypothetical protein [Culex quinquefasciatus]|eukprot:XP_001865711.1 conserved hypothetical protein [Culex quinquefasciatus]